mgnify:CR=1 FL=1
MHRLKGSRQEYHTEEALNIFCPTLKEGSALAFHTPAQGISQNSIQPHSLFSKPHQDYQKATPILLGGSGERLWQNK